MLFVNPFWQEKEKIFLCIINCKHSTRAILTRAIRAARARHTHPGVSYTRATPHNTRAMSDMNKQVLTYTGNDRVTPMRPRLIHSNDNAQVVDGLGAFLAIEPFTTNLALKGSAMFALKSNSFFFCAEELREFPVFFAVFYNSIFHFFISSHSERSFQLQLQFYSL